MIFRHFTQILCWILIVDSTVKYVQAISFDIFEYLLDSIDDSDESASSEELTTSNLNVTCKNCTLTVECHNCTHSDKDTQSTIPMQLSTQDNQQLASSPLPTPTIPAPERVVEIISSNNENVSTASQDIPLSITSAVTGGVATNGKTEEQPAPSPNTKAIENTDQTIADQANASTDALLDSSDSFTSGNETTTTTTTT